MVWQHELQHDIVRREARAQRLKDDIAYSMNRAIQSSVSISMLVTRSAKCVN